MNRFEKEMVDILCDLRENYSVINVRAEFEAEGARFEEVLKLQNIAHLANLPLTFKIGGCEAIKDLYDARTLGAVSIIAPMIESAYAMQKFVQAVQRVFSEENRMNMSFFINIETITGVHNWEEIVSSPWFNYIDGVVIGRVDLSSSLGLSRKEIDSEKIDTIVEKISQSVFKSHKLFAVGGGISFQSMNLFRRLPLISFVETRKIVFSGNGLLALDNVKNALDRANDFELLWLKNKRDYYGDIYKEDIARIELLESRKLEKQ